MTKIRARGEDIRKFILNNVENNPAEIGRIAATHFGVTRQAIHKHLKRLTVENALSESGYTRNKMYKLVPLLEWKRDYRIVPGFAEDRVWREDIREILTPMPDNVINIWHYGFTEMFNNAIDHSGGSEITVLLRKTAKNTEMMITDNGLGIFKKIQIALNLLDERHALLELSKGKLTTDSKNHTGEGIFFTSRMFDSYDVLSGGVHFSHKFGESEDWMFEINKLANGTAVWMKLDNHTSRRSKKIFDQYTSGDDFNFNKTVVPVKLAQYGNDKLISRSQAKRLLARVELFKVVMFDFNNVDSIGQAFADEIFRVFALQHPNIELTLARANKEVMQMVDRARSGLKKIKSR